MARDIRTISEITKLDGGMASSPDEERLLHAIIDADSKAVDNAKLIAESINQSACFIPDLLFDKLVTQFSMAKSLYGSTLLRQLTGYSASYLEKNLRIPEFQRHLKERLQQRVEELKDSGLVDREGNVTDTGLLAAALLMYVEELDHLASGSFGERHGKEKALHGEVMDRRPFRREDRYRSLDVRESIKLAIRRGHATVESSDLRSSVKERKGVLTLAFCLDASASMKGKKLESCKKAGIALAYKAIQEGDEVALVIFGQEVKETLAPSSDFLHLLRVIAAAQARQQTNIADSITAATSLLSHATGSKHILLITDALPTSGKDPELATVEAAANARNNAVTLSVIGIQLDSDGRKLAERIVDLGEGRLYAVRNAEGIDRVVLQDYDLVKREG
ncbi:MAG: VWA domain-containing protein [Nanoarchaeota archaeon]